MTNDKEALYALRNAVMAARTLVKNGSAIVAVGMLLDDKAWDEHFPPGWDGAPCGCEEPRAHYHDRNDSRVLTEENPANIVEVHVSDGRSSGPITVPWWKMSLILEVLEKDATPAPGIIYRLTDMPNE